MEGRSAAVEAQGKLGSNVPGKILLKLRGVRAQAKRAFVNGPGNGLVELRADGAQLRGQVQIGNRFGHG